jgi:copper homeostasis protein (lipoprotein)
VKMRFAFLIICIAALVIAVPAAEADQNPLGTLPATFDGVIPCADCSGIRVTLVLRSDKTFIMRQTYLGAPHADLSSSFDLGRWSVAADGKKLILKGSAATPVQFAIVNTKTLRQLDGNGNAIPSKLNYDLRHDYAVDPISDTQLLHGMYTYLADAGIFQECNTLVKFPVAQAGDNAALESAYLKGRSAPGAPLFATLYGHFAMQPNMEGAVREFLVVDSFVKVTPGESCKPSTSVHLEGTLWELTELNGAAIDTSIMRKPTLQLDPATKTASGYASCNRIAGGKYTVDGSSLHFGDFAMTRMACLDHNVETPYVKALAATTSYRINGNTLELMGSDGKVLAKFQAATPLEGTLWNLTDLNGVAVDTSKLMSKPTLELDAATKNASGSSSCNRFNGAYTRSGDALHFEAFAMTMMACPPDESIESAYMKALAAVTSFQISGNTLELLADGKVVARYAAAK